MTASEAIAQAKQTGSDLFEALSNRQRTSNMKRHVNSSIEAAMLITSQYTHLAAVAEYHVMLQASCRNLMHVETMTYERARTSVHRLFREDDPKVIPRDKGDKIKTRKISKRQFA